MSADTWDMGRRAEDEWAWYLVRRGRLVVPIYKYEANRAPMLETLPGSLIAPDMLELGAVDRWWEVKSKSQPGFLRRKARWEHGIDWSNYQHYRQVQADSGIPVWFAIREEQAPMSDTAEALQPGPVWLVASLDMCDRHGEYRKEWQGGGWLFPRGLMQEVKP